MGQLRLLVPRRELVGHEALARAYLAGMDDLPWRTRLSWTEDGLLAERTDRDSCYFHVPWQVPGHGHLALSTATLIERDAPYVLPVELARGTLNRLRNHLSAWEAVGLIASPAVSRQIQAATLSLGHATLHQSSNTLAAADEAQVSLQASLDGIVTLIDDYIEQSISARRRGNGRLPTLLGATIGESKLTSPQAAQLRAACNMACVPITWRFVEHYQGQFDWSTIDRQIEECHALGLRVCAGPVIRLTRADAPDWLSLWEGDIEHLLAFVTTFVQAAVQRYRGKVALWHAAAGVNSMDAVELPEEQQLRVAAHVLDAFRQADPQAPFVLSVDQPWAEYMARRDHDLSPLHFVDALARADLGVAGLGVELNFGFGPHASLPRDCLEISRQLDRWSSLGLPLVVFPRLPDHLEGAAERAWVERFLGLLLAKPAVQGIFWGQWQDRVAPGQEPLGGLVDRSGQAKPALAACESVRERWLN